MVADPLVQRQSVSSEASDYKSRQEHPRGGQRNIWNTPEAKTNAIASMKRRGYSPLPLLRVLWQWATRRHPTKGARWVKEKYFKASGIRHWVFAATEEREDGTQREVTLLNECDTPIQRHVKIKSDANPHDPTWEQYFETRRFHRWLANLRSSRSRRSSRFRTPRFLIPSLSA